MQFEMETHSASFLTFVAPRLSVAGESNWKIPTHETRDGHAGFGAVCTLLRRPTPVSTVTAAPQPKRDTSGVAWLLSSTQLSQAPPLEPTHSHHRPSFGWNSGPVGPETCFLVVAVCKHRGESLPEPTSESG